LAVAAHVRTGKMKVEIAELARHNDVAVHRHVVEIIAGEPFQDAGQALA
jgi:hypothetical protein